MSAMPARALHPSMPPTLRVAIAVADPLRRRALVSIVAAAGHVIAEAEDNADVILSDGQHDTPHGVPILSLGGVDRGYAGALPRDSGAAQIDAALRAVAAGLVVRAPGQARAVFEPMADQNVFLLSPRELEILGAIGEGLSNKSVARRLGISPHTVKFHVESLFRKLGAVSRADAVAKGMRQQIIEL
jgi:DNA-binding CsgD family transcriptional regulator